MTRAAAAQTPDLSPVYRRVALANGLILGLGLALGAWGWEAWRLAQLPTRMQFPSLVAGTLLVVGLGALAGWLTGRTEKAGPAFLAWLLTAALVAYVIGYQPTWGRTLAIWIADRRFWGLPVLYDDIGLTLAPLFGGLFVLLALALLALLQNYRLEAISREVGANGRLLPAGWRRLLLPLPLVIAAGYVTTVIVGDPASSAIETVSLAIERGRSYEGDLFALGLAEGVNYSALNPVRDQLAGRYTLTVGTVDAANALTYIVAHFESGAWINCRLLGESLSFCFDAAPPYTVGLRALLTGTAVPASCLACLPRVGPAEQAWLDEHGASLGEDPRISRQAQWGRYVVMRAEGNDRAMDCWFDRLSPVTLSRCDMVTP